MIKIDMRIQIKKNLFFFWYRVYSALLSQCSLLFFLKQFIEHDARVFWLSVVKFLAKCGFEESDTNADSLRLTILAQVVHSS